MRRLDRGDRRVRLRGAGAVRTDSVRYDVLNRLFRQVPISPGDVLVDVGCGKGRVIGWWLARGHENRLVGIELDPAIAAKLTARFAGTANVRIVVGDVLDHLPTEGTRFWLYNSFDHRIMTGFRDRLKQVCGGGARLVYAEAKQIHLFQQDPSIVCEPLRPGWLATGPAYLIQLKPRDLETPGPVASACQG